MRISARKVSQFRYAYRAGYSMGYHNLVRTDTKTRNRWWNRAFWAGWHAGRRRRQGWYPPKWGLPHDGHL